MRKLLFALLVGAFVFSYALSASATELKTYGYMRAFVSHVTNWNFNDKTDGDEFTAASRLRPYFDFIASENLKATLGLEFDTTWGKPRTGLHRDRAGEAGMDTASNTELKRAMLTFKWPGTDITIKAGAQGVALPGTFGASPILGADVTGVMMSMPVNDMVSLTMGWLRPFDASAGIGGNGGEIDAFLLAAPIKCEGFSVTPYFAYGQVDSKVADGPKLPGEVDVLSGQAVADIAAGTFNMDDADLWYAGVEYKVSMFEPLTIKGSLIYGLLNTSPDKYDREGWWLDLDLEYKLPQLTAAVYGIYASGDDDDMSDGSETIPYLAVDGWMSTPGAVAVGCGSTFAFSERNYSLAQNTPAAIWLIGFALKDISFIDNLKSTFAIEYGQGTNDSKLIKNGGTTAQIDEFYGNGVFTDEDSFVQVSLKSKYKIYENLSAILELGYASLNMDEDTWGKNYLDDPLYLATFGFSYSF